jgi:hypothetical protein
MILATLVAASLLVTSSVVPVSVDRSMLPGRGMKMPAEQKAAVIRPLVSSATDCIARNVSTDPRFATAGGAEFNSLIVESVPSCADALRSMIDAYDRVYGDGEGENFFMGPYLDSLPDAVTRRVKNTR